MAMGKKGGNMSYEAVHIAKYIINKCTIDQHPISNLQLQKILYCIQRDFLKNDMLAFDDDFEAWPFGPGLSLKFIIGIVVLVLSVFV